MPEKKEEIKELVKVLKSFTAGMSEEQILLQTLEGLAEHILKSGYVRKLEGRDDKDCMA